MREHFVCPNCGPHVRADEDGCCGTCGRDTTEEACNEGATCAMPPEVRLALRIVLNHVEPGWAHCVAIVRRWYDTSGPCLGSPQEKG